jgi:hypothetical protein
MIGEGHTKVLKSNSLDTYRITNFNDLRNPFQNNPMCKTLSKSNHRTVNLEQLCPHFQNIAGFRWVDHPLEVLSSYQ